MPLHDTQHHRQNRTAREFEVVCLCYFRDCTKAEVTYHGNIHEKIIMNCIDYNEASKRKRLWLHFGWLFKDAYSIKPTQDDE